MLQGVKTVHVLNACQIASAMLQSLKDQKRPLNNSKLFSDLGIKASKRCIQTLIFLIKYENLFGQRKRRTT
ncbi:hypothetical protein [Holospora obtusa]|uniref:hypothetical protein n=1 Tax=Holospora obtusa TaxID=49893 RepID=UPI0012EBF7E3|nr:hypothetical protein [Holospora obtusa]